MSYTANWLLHIFVSLHKHPPKLVILISGAYSNTWAPANILNLIPALMCSSTVITEDMHVHTLALYFGLANVLFCTAVLAVGNV